MDSTQNRSKRLYKSRRNRVIDGVCGGIGEYFDVDPTIVRILWVFLTFLGGSGLILYIVAMVIMPVNREDYPPGEAAPPSTVNPDRRRYWGIVLILIGMFVLIERTEVLSGFSWWAFSRTFLFPVSLIVIGLMFIYAHTRRIPPPVAASPDGGPVSPQSHRELRRSSRDKKICGVCGGMAQYFGYDSTIVRILFVFLVLASFGWGLLLYVILCLLMPEERTETVSA